MGRLVARTYVLYPDIGQARYNNPVNKHCRFALAPRSLGIFRPELLSFLFLKVVFLS